MPNFIQDTCAHVCACMHAHPHTNTHIQTQHKNTCRCAYIQEYMQACTYKQTQIHTHINTMLPTHTLTPHTHTSIQCIILVTLKYWFLKAFPYNFGVKSIPPSSFLPLQLELCCSFSMTSFTSPVFWSSLLKLRLKWKLLVLGTSGDVLLGHTGERMFWYSERVKGSMMKEYKYELQRVGDEHRTLVCGLPC